MCEGIDLQAQLLALRNYCNRYGVITSDARCEIAGNHDRITTYSIEGKRITISMHNGKISHVTY
jgi:hypothetical protein